MPLLFLRGRAILICLVTDSSLDDLHQFRTRSLVFVHDICKKLGAAGVSLVCRSRAVFECHSSFQPQIQVSYRLALSDSPLVLLRALPDDSVCTRDEHDALELVKRSSR